jgi:hypothetical protein
LAFLFPLTIFDQIMPGMYYSLSSWVSRKMHFLQLTIVSYLSNGKFFQNGQVYENGVPRPAEYGATSAAHERSAQHSGNQRNVAEVNIVGQRNSVGISQS